MKPIALATSYKYPNLTDDDRLLLAPLADCGLQAEPAVWNDPSHDWSSNGAVVIRSCWDYHLHPEQFVRWIADLEAANIPVFNRATLILWNANKTYLRDLEARNIAIVPTFWAEDNGATNTERTRSATSAGRRPSSSRASPPPRTARNS